MKKKYKYQLICCKIGSRILWFKLTTYIHYYCPHCTVYNSSQEINHNRSIEVFWLKKSTLLLWNNNWTKSRSRGNICHNGMDHWTNARCVVWSLVAVRMAIKLKYRNTLYIHTDTEYISHIQYFFLFHCIITILCWTKIFT